MKFTIHNLRMIKARFSSNGWVLAELFLVFIVMWFLCDSLGCMKYTFYRPLGYNIEHVYKLSTVVGGESRDTSLTVILLQSSSRWGRPVLSVPIVMELRNLGSFIIWERI